MIEVAITFAGTVSEKQAAKMVHARAEAYNKDPSEENFVALIGACTIVTLMPAVKKHGLQGCLNIVKESGNAHLLLDRLNGKLS